MHLETLTEQEIIISLIAIAFLLSGAYIFGNLFERIKAPRVVGEIVGGMFWGGSCLYMSAKRTGADIHHISTAGYPLGSPPPENLYTYSVAVRGVRHTWNRMAWNLRNHWESL